MPKNVAEALSAWYFCNAKIESAEHKENFSAGRKIILVLGRGTEPHQAKNTYPQLTLDISMRH